MFTNNPLFFPAFTNISQPSEVPILRSNQPDIWFAILITIGLLIVIKLFAMAYIMFSIEYRKYQYRKYMRMKENVLSEEKLKSMYSNIRAKYNGNQLEFPFVKAIDDAYVAARYNLNAEEEE